MTPLSWRRSTAALVGTLALTTAFAAGAPSALAHPGKAVPLSLFPSDDLTVPDPGQLTGRRIALPTTGCGAPVSCGLVQELDQLDGFDLDPRIAVQFSGPVDPAEAAARITVKEAHGGWRTGVDRVVWDPATNTLYAHPVKQLAPGTTYRLRVQGGPANQAAQDQFTTMSATDGLLDLRRQLDDGSAFSAAGITAPGLQVEGTFPAAGTTVTWTQDQGATDVPTPVVVPEAATGGTLVFGSYLAPTWLQPDVTIDQTPTRDAGPTPVGQQRLPFVAVLPPGTPPPGGWPVAVFGHGFTANDTNVLLAAVANSQQGIATIGTNVVGHGYGAGSSYTITSGGATTALSSYGRGVDQDGNGQIASTEGSSATGAAAAQSSRDALRQTAADIMTLIRSVGGTDVDADGTPDLSGDDVTYFGQSFGGIYGTMLTGADPAVTRSVLNVAGGPITEISRLSPSFRPLIAAALEAAGLLNSTDPTRNLFQEQLPLRGEGPVTVTVPGAVAIQEHLARATWLARPGSPETFSPLIEPERALFQVAFGDQTVPNPTAYTVIDAGDLWSRTSLYRNDRTANAANNPHAFLLILLLPAAAQGQAQVAAFLGRGEVIDPDGAGAVWEVPISDPAVLLPLNSPQPALRP
ncbi:Ig-like domain-containing protein [Modestobacter excelsi]|uniref:Ig-like domain-containing protein n=1 Tax=Modestobacter excelsi TaxID=2213161 RepID=UPI00110C9FF2|nr:Ig-like domain-containing protein [Modestobacter excelsi]